MSDGNLIVNIALAAGAALLGALIALALRQSVIIGYMLGGLLIGPHTPGFVGDEVAVQQLADIGVILLMFAIGLQLSVRQLISAGPVALGGGAAQVVITIMIGWVVGQTLGWTSIESLFFGAVLSNSSSTVLSKVLGDRGEAGSSHGQIGLAWSTVQDLSTIVLVVVLSALAAGGNGLFSDLAWSAVRALIFLLLLIPIGSRALPWAFAHVARFNQREVFILSVAAVALVTAYVASLFGLSLALGAFVAGVVVSESDLSHQILGEIIPLRDLFAGLFFVSVGMLVDPVFVINNIPLVLLTLFLIVVVKGALIVGITMLFRFPLRLAILTGLALAQCAEFSFLLARIGADLGAVSSDVFSLMLAGSALSIVLAPALMAGALPAVRWAERRLPSTGLAVLPAGIDEATLSNHAILCGYGRVGRIIGEVMLDRELPLLVIDQEQHNVQELRRLGVPALLGSADNPAVLQRAGLERARVLIVAIPDPITARRVVDLAKQVNPGLRIVVRTHTQEDRDALVRTGVDEVVLGERELAIEMTRFALDGYGLSLQEIQQQVDVMRFEGASSPYRLRAQLRDAERHG
jgi:monovalent cation:H+ antiporter-2, CPA2 family